MQGIQNSLQMSTQAPLQPCCCFAFVFIFWRPRWWWLGGGGGGCVGWGWEGAKVYCGLHRHSLQGFVPVLGFRLDRARSRLGVFYLLDTLRSSPLSVPADCSPLQRPSPAGSGMNLNNNNNGQRTTTTTGHDGTRRDTTGRTERGYSFIYDYKV